MDDRNLRRAYGARRKSTQPGAAGDSPGYPGQRQPRRKPQRRRHRTVTRNGRVVPHFCQGDSRWSNRLMNDDDTISRAGCAITSCAMVMSFFGRDVTPADVDAYMDAEGGYMNNSDGIGDWNIALGAKANRGPQVTLARSIRLYAGGDADLMQQAIKDSLRNNVPVIARIVYPQKNSASDVDHFALIVGRCREGWVLNDPALTNGHGAADATLPDVVLQTATRNGGLQLVGADILNVNE